MMNLKEKLLYITVLKALVLIQDKPYQSDGQSPLWFYTDPLLTDWKLLWLILAEREIFHMFASFFVCVWGFSLIFFCGPERILHCKVNASFAPLAARKLGTGGITDLGSYM